MHDGARFVAVQDVLQPGLVKQFPLFQGPPLHRPGMTPGQVVITDGGKTTASQGLAGMAAYVTGPAGDQYITG